MKLTVLSEHLQKKIQLINKGVSSKSQLPILLNILLEAKNGKLHINSTDLEIGIQTSIPVNIEEEGSVTTPARIFSDLISALSSEKITIQTKNTTLEIITTKTKSVLQTTPSEEFPKLYEEKGKEIMQIKKETLQKDFSRVVFAASFDTSRPALSGVYIKQGELGNKLLLVATDGYRLSLQQAKKEVELEKPLLIPVRVLREVMGIKEENNIVNMFIAEQKNQVLFEQGETVVVGRLIDAQFPQYEKIIPTDFSTRALFDRQELLKAVKMSAVFARESANIIRFSLKKDMIIVSANSAQVGENTVEVEAKVKGEETEIAFNARYLLDFLGTIEEEDIVLEMTTPTSPGVFKIKDDPSFLHLIMPIRVQTEE